MDALAFFYLQHARVQSSNVASGSSLADLVFGSLTDQQMRVRPGEGLNSLVWLPWHMARVEDVAVNLVLTAGRQVLDDGWSSRLDIPRTDVGRGMNEDEVGSTGLAELVSRADAARVPRGFGALEDQPRAVELGTSAITHNAVHLGEAATIRRLARFSIGI